jgi:prolipoprotein diacylglyceryltransferase
MAIDRRTETGRAFLFPLFLGLYGVSRFATEFLRYRKEPGWLASQWVELAAVAGIALLLTAGRSLWMRYLDGGPREPAPASSPG